MGLGKGVRGRVQWTGPREGFAFARPSPMCWCEVGSDFAVKRKAQLGINQGENKSLSVSNALENQDLAEEVERKGKTGGQGGDARGPRQKHDSRKD